MQRHIFSIEYLKFQMNKLIFIHETVLYRLPDHYKNKIVVPKMKVRLEMIDENNCSDAAELFGDAIIDIFQNFYRQGEIGIYIRFNEIVVGYAWAVINDKSKIRLANGYFPLKNNYALIHYCSVAPEFRGKGLYQYLLTEMYRILLPKQLNAIFVDTGCDNLPAKAAIKKSGAKKIGLARFSVLFRKYSFLRVMR